MKPDRRLAIRSRQFRLRYPRFRIRPGLMPMGQMRPISDKDSAEGVDYDWRIEESDANFILLGDRPTAGWNMIELGITHDQRSAAACLTFDLGRGFERRHSIFLVIRRGKVSKRVCFVPYGTKRIRLEPLIGQRGQFRIDHFNVVWLTPRFACGRMINRLGYADKRFQEVDEKAIVRALKQEGKEEGVGWKKLLSAYYEATFIHCAPETSYEYWQEHIEILREPSANKVARQQSQFSDPVDLAVVLVPGESDAEMADAHHRLLESIRSISEQRYPRWRLYVPDCVLTDHASREWVERIVARDARIQRVDGDAAEAVTAACAGSDDACDYVMFVRAGDRLGPNSLFHIANHCQIRADAEIIYGDDDVIDASGERTAPNFKPQWNLDLLLATNYVGHAVAFAKAQLVSRLAALSGSRGVDLHRLLLELATEVEPARIHHVPFVIYHNAVPVGQSASESLEAVSTYLKSVDPRAVVAPAGDKGYRITWSVPEPAPLVSLLVPTRDRVEILRPCVDTLLAVTRYPNYEVIILDNGSTCAETLDYMKSIAQDPRVRVLRYDAPFNYSAINNYGVHHAQGSIIGLVNNDIEPINPDWLTEMVGHACRPDIGCVGAKLYYPNDTVQHGGVILGLGGVAGHAHRFFPRSHAGYQNRLSLVQNLSAITAACLLVRREVYDEVDGLNERDLTVAYNDVDFCLKVREKGYRNLWTPFAELYHHESISRGADDNPEKQARAKREVDYMRRQWREALQQDPAYNPNLTMSYEDFSLR